GLAGARRRSAQRPEIAHNVVEILLAQLVDPERRHQRTLLRRNPAHVRLQIPLQALAGLHHLDGEKVLVLSRALNRAPFLGRDRDRLIPWPDVLDGAANLPDERLSSSADTDPRKIRTQHAAARADAMAAAALRPENALPVLGIAARRLDRRRHIQRPDVHDDLPGVRLLA